MQLTSFSLNKTIVLFEQTYCIQSIIDSRALVLRDSSGNTRNIDIEVLMGHYLSGNLRATKTQQNHSNDRATPRKISTRSIVGVSEGAKAKSLQRAAYLAEIENRGIALQKNNPSLQEVVRLIAQRLGDQHPPSVATLGRWARRLRHDGGDPAALVPYYERRGAPGKCRFPSDVTNLLKSVIDNEYLTTKRESASKIYQVFRAKLAEKNQWRPLAQQFQTPSFSTFLRQIQKLPGYEVMASRNGAQEAKRQYRSTGRNPEDYSLNECWEVDHTVLDLFVVDEHTRLVLGRPRLTVMLDHFTRIPMGIDIGFTGTSAQSVLNCLKHGVKPKSYLKEKYPEVQGEWPCFGVPRILKCDNGPEFHSESLKHACFELSIELQYCPIKSPWFKGRIERFFRTFNGEFSKILPGSTGSHLYDLPENTDPAKYSVIDLTTLRRLIHIWLIDIYMPGNHGGSL